MTNQVQISNSKSITHSNQIVIVSNGILDDWIASQIRQEDFVIGVDRAAWWLMQHNIISDIAIGDFDSCTKEELSAIKAHISDVRKFNSNKDETDLELAVDAAVAVHPRYVTIYGAIGSRMDHTIANIFLLKKLHDLNINGLLIDQTNKVKLAFGTTVILKDIKYRYISILPFSNECMYDISGCTYSGLGIYLRKGDTRGISNEIIGSSAEIIVSKGIALVIQSRD